MIRKLAALAAAFLCVGVAACGSLSTTQGQTDALDTSWTLAKASATAYVATCALNPKASLCSDAVVAGVQKALQEGDVAVTQAKAALVAAGSDQTAASKAVAIGLAAIATFEQTIAIYGLGSAPAAAAKQG